MEQTPSIPGPDQDDRNFRRAVEVVHGGFVTPHRLTGLPGKLSGCVYRSDGSKVALSERFGGYMRDHTLSDNPEYCLPPQAVSKLSGRGVYLGHYMSGHYGHFITEGLSTFWILQDQPASTFDYVLFHPFVFGRSEPGYVQFCLDRFEITRDKVIVVGNDYLGFDELVVPERLLRLNHSGDSRLRWVYQHLAAGARAPSEAAEILYVSRRRFSRRKFERVVANEVQIEDEFARYGFRTLYPETLSFEDQIALYSRAKTVAGLSGSALHNSLFMQAGARLIELGDPRYEGEPAPTQAACNTVSGVQAEFIPFVGRQFGSRWTLLFNIGFLRKNLANLLGEPSPKRPPGGGLQRFGHRLLGLMDVVYLCVRPSLGAWARKVLPRKT